VPPPLDLVHDLAAYLGDSDLATVLKEGMSDPGGFSGGRADQHNLAGVYGVLLLDDAALRALLGGLGVLGGHVDPFDHDHVPVLAFEDLEDLALFSLVFTGDHTDAIAFF